MKKCIGKLNNGNGFTLLEMLIVVAIIGIMVATAIPFAADQLERSREASDLSIIRSSYSELMLCALTGDVSGTEVMYDASSETYSITLSNLQQRIKGWNLSSGSLVIGGISRSDGLPHWAGDPADGDNSCRITYSDADGTVIKWGGAAASQSTLVQKLEPVFFNDSLITNSNTLGGYIVSNKPALINEALAEQGITDAQAFITNAGSGSVYDYTYGILTANGVVGASYIKVVSVTTDGKVLSDLSKGDTVDVIQYLYYKSTEKIGGSNRVILYGTREVKATVSNNSGNGALTFDMSDADGHSWTKN